MRPIHVLMDAEAKQQSGRARTTFEFLSGDDIIRLIYCPMGWSLNLTTQLPTKVKWLITVSVLGIGFIR